jgi:endonuclease YncB( thermonuclease family)
MMNVINETVLRTDEDRTDVEAWLLEMGLRAIVVDECPVPNCEACHPVLREAA